MRFRTFCSKYIDTPMLAILLMAGTLSLGIGLLIAEEERETDRKTERLQEKLQECEARADAVFQTALRAVDLAETTTLALQDCTDTLQSVRRADEVCGLAL